MVDRLHAQSRTCLLLLIQQESVHGVMLLRPNNVRITLNEQNAREILTAEDKIFKAESQIQFDCSHLFNRDDVRNVSNLKYMYVSRRLNGTLSYLTTHGSMNQPTTLR